MDTKELARRLVEAEQLIASIRNSLATEPTSSVRKRTQEEIDRLTAARICLRCGKPLGEKKPQRGVHEACYQKLRREHALGEAASIGHLLPTDKPGRKSAPAILETGADIIAMKRITHSKKSNRDRK